MGGVLAWVTWLTYLRGWRASVGRVWRASVGGMCGVLACVASVGWVVC